MSEECLEDNRDIFSICEIHEMFDSGFLSSLQEIAKRTKSKRFAGQNIAYFVVNMVLQLDDLITPITYASLKDKVRLQMQPVLQEDVEGKKNENPTDD